VRHPLLTAAFLTGASFVATPAHADHDDVDGRATYQTARTLSQGELEIGLMTTDVGLFDAWNVGLDHLYFALPIFNLHTKVRIYRDEDFAISVSGSVYYFNVDLFWWANSPTTRGWLVAWPIDATVSIPLADRFSLHTFAVLTMTSGKLEQSGDDYGGTAAANNFQIGLTPEWRITSHVALNLRLRFAPWVDVSGAASGTIQLDPATTVDVGAEAELDTSEAELAFSALLAIHLVWDWFNLRLGAGWGNFNLPGLNFLFVQRGPIFEFGVFARF
jgi:hypothetical protein